MRTSFDLDAASKATLEKLAAAAGESQAEILRTMLAVIADPAVARAIGIRPIDGLKSLLADGLRARMASDSDHPITIAQTASLEADAVATLYLRWREADHPERGEWHCEQRADGTWTVLHRSERLRPDGSVERVFESDDVAWRDTYSKWHFARELAKLPALKLDPNERRV